MTEPPTMPTKENAALLERVFTHLPPGQVSRYLAVGVWNTFFGYGLFVLITYLLTGIVPFAYMLASILSNVIAITVAFLGYKWFVFKTRGHYLREYLRCYLVYGTAFLVNITLLPILVAILMRVVPREDYAAFIAGAILTGGPSW